MKKWKWKQTWKANVKKVKIVGRWSRRGKELGSFSLLVFSWKVKLEYSFFVTWILLSFYLGFSSAFERHREQVKWELKAIPRKPLKIFLSSTLVRMFPRWPFIRRTSLRVIDCKEGRLLTKHFSFVNTNQSDHFRHFFWVISVKYQSILPLWPKICCHLGFLQCKYCIKLCHLISTKQP